MTGDAYRTSCQSTNFTSVGLWFYGEIESWFRIHVSCIICQNSPHRIWIIYCYSSSHRDKWQRKVRLLNHRCIAWPHQSETRQINAWAWNLSPDQHSNPDSPKYGISILRKILAYTDHCCKWTLLEFSVRMHGMYLAIVFSTQTKSHAVFPVLTTRDWRVHMKCLPFDDSTFRIHVASNLPRIALHSVRNPENDNMHNTHEILCRLRQSRLRFVFHETQSISGVLK